MESYDEQAGQDLVVYLKKFESYCKDNYRGGKSFWLSELETRLNGHTLETFKAMKDASDDYDEMKSKLVDWFTEEKINRKVKARKSFRNIRLKRGESLIVYASRVQSLFKQAYPNKDTMYSGTLINKLRDTIPKIAQTKLDPQIVQHKMINTRMSWTKVLKCLRMCEVEDCLLYTSDAADE